MKAFFQIFKHEIRKILSDKKMLVSMIFMPVFIVALTSFLSIPTGLTDSDASTPTAYSLNDINVVGIDGFEISPVKYKTLNELNENVQLKSSDIVLDFSLTNNSVVIYYDYTNPNSYNLATFYELLLYEDIAGRYIEDTDFVNVSFVDTNKEVETENLLIATMLPYMLILLLFQNTSNYAIDAVAGEKERGVFDKSLLTPISPFSIVGGKILSSAICGIVSCIFYFGIVFISEHLTKQDIFGLRSAKLNTEMILSIFLCSVILCFFFAMIGVLYSLRAKTVKDAQNSCKIILMLVTVSSLISMFRTGTVSHWCYLVPVYNISLIIQDALYCILNTKTALTAIASLLFCSSISFVAITFILAKNYGLSLKITDFIKKFGKFDFFCKILYNINRRRGV